MTKRLDGHNDERGMLMWTSPTLLGFDYKYLTIGTINKGHKRGGHYHKRIVEKLLCISGEMVLELINTHNKKKVKYQMKPGDVRDIPIEHSHTLYNKSDGVSTFLEFKSEEFNEEDKDTYTMEK